MSRRKSFPQGIHMRPVLFTIPYLNLPLYSYGFLLGLAFMSGFYVTFHFTRREGMRSGAILWGMIAVMLFSMAGARAAYIFLIMGLENVSPGDIPGLILSQRYEGLVAYGGFIGGTLAILVYTQVREMSFWSFVDCAAPALALGLGITRLGCFLSGCCHGRPAGAFWGVVFPVGSRGALLFPDPSSIPGQACSVPLHPTQLYESALGFLILLPLSLRLMQRKRFQGQVFLTFMLCYAAARFCLEFIRGDNAHGWALGPLSTSQLVSLGIAPLALGLFLYRARRAHGRGREIPVQ